MMKYIRYTSSIPIPEVFGSGICWAGPYIVMLFLEAVSFQQDGQNPYEV
jgi:hypothetical protein